MLYYKIYIDLIITLIIGALHFTSIPISTFSGALLVRYGIVCLRLFVVILQDLHCLHRSYHNVDHCGIKLYHHINFHI